MRNIILSLFLSLPLCSFSELPTMELIGEMQLPEPGYGNTYNLILHNNIAYLSYFNSRTSTPRIVMIDLSIPESPAVIGEYQTEDITAANGTQAQSLQAKNDVSISLYGTPKIVQMDLEYPFLYIPHDFGFDVVDVSNPAQARKVSSYTSENSGYSGIAIKIAGSKAIFSTEEGITSFLALNENNQWALTATASFQNPLLRGGWGTHILWDGGDTAYIRLQSFARSTSGPSALLVLDVSDFSNPQTRSVLDFPFLVEGSQNLFTQLYDALPFIFTTAYIRAERDYKIALINIANPANPVLVEPLSGQPWVTELIDMGRYVLGAATEDGIAFYEKLAEPPYLSLLGTVFNPDYDDNGYRHLAAQGEIIVGVAREYDRSREVFKVFRMQRESSINYFSSYQ